MKAKETFGSILKRLREEKGLTQRQLAELVKVKQPHIARLESNPNAMPLWKTVQLLADTLGVPCDAFKQAAEPTKPATKGKRPKKNGA